MGLMTLIALIIGIIGGTDADQTSDVNKYNTGKHMQQGAAILYVIFYVGLLFISGFIFTNLRYLVPAEKKIYTAVVLTLPFLFVRLMFSVISAFSSFYSKFSIFEGSVWIFFGMAVVMEIIVVLIYTVVAIITPKPEAAQPTKEGNAGFVQNQNGNGNGYTNGHTNGTNGYGNGYNRGAELEGQQQGIRQ
jgi:hypothetical protein